MKAYMHVSGLPERPRKPVLYWKVVDELDNTLYASNSIKLCQHWRKVNNLVNQTLIKSVR